MWTSKWHQLIFLVKQRFEIKFFVSAKKFFVYIAGLLRTPQWTGRGGEGNGDGGAAGGGGREELFLLLLQGGGSGRGQGGCRGSVTWGNCFFLFLRFRDLKLFPQIRIYRFVSQICEFLFLRCKLLEYFTSILKRKYQIMTILNWFSISFSRQGRNFLFLQGYFFLNGRDIHCFTNWTLGIQNQGTRPNPNP